MADAVDLLVITDKDKARFWAKVLKAPGCWLWTASLAKRGRYGQFMVRGRLLKAHRVAFFLVRGYWPDPNGCHTCDNPPCCNPDHVFAGTIADNHADMMAKGRGYIPDSPRGLRKAMWYLNRKIQKLEKP